MKETQYRDERFPWFLRLLGCGFRWRRYSFLEAVGYEDASYGNSANGERNIEASFRWEN
jgi:hypothetical protein